MDFGSFEINENLIQTQTQLQILNEVQFLLKEINPNLTFESNTPAGIICQLVALLTKRGQDVAVSIVNNLDPNTATGKWLDLLLKFFPQLSRNGGSKTIIGVDVITSGACNLQGKDGSDSETGVFSIQDSSNNKFFLVNSISIVAAGTFNMAFEAQNVGATNPTINSVNLIITPIVNVLSVNNPSPAIKVGSQMESDFSVRTSIQVAQSSGGERDVNKIRTALLRVENINEAYVYENDTSSTNADGITGKTLYAVVNAGATDADIGYAIAVNKTGGAITMGSKTTLIEGNVIHWDEIVSQAIYAQLTVKKASSSSIINETELKDYLVSNVNFTLNATMFASLVEQAAQDYLDGSGGVTNSKIKLLVGDAWVEYLPKINLYTRGVLTTANISLTIDAA